MAKTYRECNDDVVDLADDVLRRWHPELIEAGVTITYLFANSDTGQALTHGGYPAAAVIKRTPLKDRVAGHRDLILTIDENWWNNHNQKECVALLDHEFAHALVARADDGNGFETDDAERPKIEIRKHDFQIGGFHEIVERHHLAAVECLAVAECSRKWKQFGLFSGDDMKPDAGAA